MVRQSELFGRFGRSYKHLAGVYEGEGLVGVFPWWFESTQVHRRRTEVRYSNAPRVVHARARSSHAIGRLPAWPGSRLGLDKPFVELTLDIGRRAKLGYRSQPWFLFRLEFERAQLAAAAAGCRSGAMFWLR
jgi:hypothetical protein